MLLHAPEHLAAELEHREFLDWVDSGVVDFVRRECSLFDKRFDWIAPVRTGDRHGILRGEFTLGPFAVECGHWDTGLHRDLSIARAFGDLLHPFLK